MRWSILMLSFFAITPLCHADEYPTPDTVRMVLQCMDKIGGVTEENLSTCSCRHDLVASKMSYRDYFAATMYWRYSKLPADKGETFRDSVRGRKLVHRLTDVLNEAESSCPVVKQIRWNPDHKKKSGDSGN